MEKLHLCPFSFLSSCHLLIGCLHITCISILIVTACIRENLFFIVVLSLTDIYILQFIFSCYCTIISLSSLIKILLTMVKIVFKLFLEKHFVSITYSFIFIKTACIGLRFKLSLSDSRRMLRLWARRRSILNFFIRRKQFLSVIGLYKISKYFDAIDKLSFHFDFFFSRSIEMG